MGDGQLIRAHRSSGRCAWLDPRDPAEEKELAHDGIHPQPDAGVAGAPEPGSRSVRPECATGPDSGPVEPGPAAGAAGETNTGNAGARRVQWVRARSARNHW